MTAPAAPVNRTSLLKPGYQALNLAALDDDLTSGRYRLADLLWRATLERAAELSRAHTKSVGCRSLDVLHVASALELEMKQFLTFDVRQTKLARAAGLKVIRPSA